MNSMEERRRGRKAIGMTVIQHLKVMALYNVSVQCLDVIRDCWRQCSVGE